MRDYLPPIHINVTGSLRGFLKSMANIAEKSGAFTVDQELDAFGTSGCDVVNLRLIKSPQHRGLGGQLIVQPERKNSVAVEIRAERWSPDDPPTYETYVAEGRALIGPLLSAYNREFGTRYRMTIPAKCKLQPKLPPQSAKLFRRFAALSNKSGLHWLDWRRFYEFVRDSRMRRRLADEDMVRLLVKEGFSEQHARHIAEIYGHLREFKQLA
ncbi:MAG: hypothetical protein J5I92_15285 [Thiogranum sp.]|nr:hypothetical protein [Thiogranum sp.]